MNGILGLTAPAGIAGHGERPMEKNDPTPQKSSVRTQIVGWTPGRARDLSLSFRPGPFSGSDRESKSNRSHRRREVDPHKSLPVITDSDGIDLPGPVPRVNPIELPTVSVVPDYTPPATTVSYNDHYIRFDPIPEAQRQHEVEFEAMNEDIAKLQEISKDHPGLEKRIFTVEVMEKFIDAWEQDTQKGEIIPLERARVLIVEELGFGGFWKENQGSEIISKLYHYWVERRRELKHPLVRKYWKSESASDHMLREVFQPRNHERMKLRGSRKNDRETFHKVLSPQMMKLKTNLEQVTELLQCVYKREQLKDLQCNLRLKAFEVEKADQHDTDSVKVLLSSRLVEEARRLRESQRSNEQIEYEPRPQRPPAPGPPPAPVSTPQRMPSSVDTAPAPAIPTEKNVCVELAMIACALIPFAERSGVWPLAGPEVSTNSGETWPQAPAAVPQQSDEQPVSRGRVIRGRGRRIALDRLFRGLATLQWGSYRGESGKYHEFDDDSKSSLSTEEEENDGFRDLHKFIQNQYKVYTKQRRGLAH